MKCSTLKEERINVRVAYLDLIKNCKTSVVCGCNIEQNNKVAQVNFKHQASKGSPRAKHDAWNHFEIIIFVSSRASKSSHRSRTT
jgi:hypothetical protein